MAFYAGIDPVALGRKYVYSCIHMLNQIWMNFLIRCSHVLLFLENYVRTLGGYFVSGPEAALRCPVEVQRSIPEFIGD